MPTNDERLYYIRLSKGAFTGLKLSQAFLDVRRLVKVPAAEDVEAVYYSAEDELSFEAAMRIYKPQSVALIAEAEGVAPLNLGRLSEHATLPEAMTHAIFALNSPMLQALEISALALETAANDVPLNRVLIPWGETLSNYLQTGELPV